MTIITKTEINLNEEEKKRWNEAYDTIFKIYHALPKSCEAGEMLSEILGWIEDFDAKYVRG